MSETRERFVLRLQRAGEGVLAASMDGPGGRVGERRVEWTGSEAWYRLTSDRKAVHERMAYEAEQGRDGLAPLGHILFADVVGSELAAPLLAAVGRGADVQLQIMIPADEPRLVTVPWQLLHDGESYLYQRGIAVGAQIVRPDPNLVRLDGPFRVLILFASPSDAEVPPLEAELQVLEHVYRTLPLHVRLQTLSFGVRREEIEAAWREARGFHAVHVLCPATHDTLLLEGERGRSEPLYWTTLAHTVRAWPVPWLVTLGTGRWPRDPWRLDYQLARDGVPERSGIYELGQPLDWSAFAEACAVAGVPLVLSYQLPLDARAGRAITPRFCHGVLSGELDAGAAWRLSVQAGHAATEASATGTGAVTGPPPALLGRTDLILRGLPSGPSEIASRGQRQGVDVGLFPDKPVGGRFAGRYHLTSACLRRLLPSSAPEPAIRSLVVTGPSGIGKTSFVANLLRLLGDTVHAVRRMVLRPESSVETVLGGLEEFCEANGWEPPLVALQDVAPDDHAERARRGADALVGALQGHEAILLLEDVERALEPAPTSSHPAAVAASPRFTDPAIGLLVARALRTLRGSGLWLVSADLPDLGAPLPTDVPIVRLREPQPRTARELFERHASLAALDLESTRSMYLATRGLPGLVASLALLARHNQLHAVLAELVPAKLHAESEAAYRPILTRAVVRGAMDLLSDPARRLLELAALFEKPERPMVAEQLGVPANDAVIEELAAADLLTRLRPRDRLTTDPDRGPIHLWIAPAVAEAVRERQVERNVDLDDWRERLGAFHALASLERGRAAQTAGLSDEERSALVQRRRMGLLRAFSYFVRARRWARAAEVTVRATDAGAGPSLRAELRQMCDTLLLRGTLAPLDATNVLSVLATLQAHDGQGPRALATWQRAVDAAQATKRDGVEADVRLRLARALEAAGQDTAALREAERAESLAMSDGDAPQAARAADLRGRVALEVDHPQEAADAFERAAHLFARVGEEVRSARAWRARASAMLAAGEPAAAVRALVAGWHTCPDEVDGFVLLVERVARSAGEDLLAREWLTAAKEPLPSELLLIR